MSARSRAMLRELDPGLLASDLCKLVPRANQYGDVDYLELLNDLRAFGVRTRADLRRLMLRHRREMLRIDREPFDQVNARIQRAELGEAAFGELQRKGVFFSSAGLLRLALELEHGELFREYMSKQYYGGEAGEVV
jgi:hypothetical protein